MSSIPVSHRVQRVKPSPTLAMTARAAQLRREGKDVISLSVGEPDFDTPAHISAAGIAAIQQGHTRYTNSDGAPELKDAIIAKFQRDNGLTYQRHQILVSTGAKQTLFNLCMAVVDPGDEVIIPAPYWVSYPDMVLLADGVPVTPYAGADAGFKITPQQLEQAITPRTRLVLLNSPSNPTGAAYTRAELAALGEVLLRHPRLLVGTDDIYEKIYWADEPFSSLAQVVPALYARTVTINGCSKGYAMTGWRVGYCGGPAEVVAAMATIQGQSTTNASSISQQAAIAALNGPEEQMRRMNASFRQRHDFFVAGLNALPGFRCRPGEGTFYAFVDVSAAMRALGFADDVAFCDYLLNGALVAGVPGSAFGAPGHLRLSFAVSQRNLELALERIGKALAGAAGHKA
ncbi:MAG TPA: pyridoxal phosphate-dependent aminotransferase [Steroidobacteraceae bacterium]|nr:pyridoxal phosphate-dependent aminotransferase [Steroidobacteraceae bacterium]